MNEDQIDDDFDNWWEHEENMTSNNPYRKGGVLFWAWEGWVAGRKAEREACAKVAEAGLIGHTIAQVIRARGQG